MTVLTNSQARRGGATARRWYETVDTVNVYASNAIRIKFSIAGNNNGETEVEVDIGPNDFPTLLEVMCIANRQAAMEAMSVELARQIQTQPRRDDAAKAAARKELSELADQKYHEAPVGKDDHEKLIMDALGKLVKEIETPK